MKISSTPHVHTTYVDGQACAEAMVLGALERGFTSLGFSEHARQSVDPDYGMTLSSERAYLREIPMLREKYRGRIRIHMGVEMDQYALCAKEPYEYVIGSVHYLPDEEGVTAVDESREALLELRKRCYHNRGDLLAAAYFRAVAEHALALRPHICGHFDLIRKYNGANCIYDASMPAVQSAALEALEAVRESGAMLEINTGGMARGRTASPYPERYLLRRWRELGGNVIISSDAHQPEHLDFAFDVALAMAQEAGFDHIWTLGNEGEDTFVERSCTNGKS